MSVKDQKIKKLRDQIAQCSRCELSKTRTNVVPGEGSVSSRIMFIGEAPGKNEDEQGKPFVGRAGDIFDRLLNSISLSRDDIFLCNILKCRPPSNRNPLSSEIASCVGSLNLQIKIMNPAVIAMLGNFATMYILDKFSIPRKTISSLAGTVIDVDTEFGHKKIVPLFHPAVATYSPSKIDILIEHFQVIRNLLDSNEVLKHDDSDLHVNTVSQTEMWI